jgi:arylsulfatase A-like enzyme
MNSATKKPNLVFLFTDQQRADTLAAYGNNAIKMPNLNQFARSSTVFLRAYCTQPICTPSRGSIMTGLWPHQHGCTENNLILSEDIPVLIEYLPAKEWHTAYYGKWHLGDELFRQHGFDEWISIEDQYNDYFRAGRDLKTRSSYHGFLSDQGLRPENGHHFKRTEVARYPEKLSKPAFLASKASHYLEARSKDKRPFVLYVNFLEPHPPYTGPRDNHHDWREIEPPLSLKEEPDGRGSLTAWLMGRYQRIHGSSGFSLSTDDDWRRQIARYWGLCSQVDAAVGHILVRLRQLELEKDTIVVFTSDHGDQLGDHGCHQKGVMYEQSVRIPLMIHLPGQKAMSVFRKPISQIDLVPTLLDLLGLEPRPGFPGTSLCSILEGRPPRHSADAFIEWNFNRLGREMRDSPNPGMREEMVEIGSERFGKQRAEASVYQDIRTIISSDGWKLNYSSRELHELYNLDSDPQEINNCIDDEDNKKIVSTLTEKLKRWLDATEDDFSINGI